MAKSRKKTGASGRDHRSGAAYTQEFHHEFKVETGRLLRRRFLWFTGVVGSLSIISLVVGIVGAFVFRDELSSEDAVQAAAINDPWFWLLSIVWMAIYVGSFGYALTARPSDQQLLRLSFWVVTIDGLLNVAMRTLEVPGGLGIGSFFLTHVIACLFLPWTARQSARPWAVVLIANAAAVMLIRDPIWQGSQGWDSALLLILTPLWAIPGAVWCWFRHSARTQSFKYRFMTSRYSEMRRELVDARKIHESLFPEAIESGELRFAFEYEPMRQIGGDFLFSHRDGGEHSPFSVVLLDVTGHGIPAALTVNRLHGELERVFAENPRIGPGEVLGLLNKYVNLTLASHSIYVTAFCARVDLGRSTLEYASGGHPPAFLKAVDGTIEELESTAIVLGACPPSDFETGERELRFGPGDTMMAYTDGAIEARRQDDGQMFRIAGLRGLLSSAGAGEAVAWPRVFKEHIADFRGGPPEDDTLFLTVHRSLAESAASRSSLEAGVSA